MELTLKNIQVDKRDILYRVTGRNDQFPFIMIHGLAGDSRFFHKQLKFFGNFYKMIAIDLPGHGKSSYTETQSFDLYSRSIEKVVEKESIKNYILVGHSMGGIVCIKNYLLHKKNVKALILISTSSKLPVTEKMINDSITDFNFFYHKLLTTIFHKKAGIFINAAHKNITDNEKKIITMDLKICSEVYYDDILNKIDVPVLLIANKYDEMVPASLTGDMQKKIKNSKIILFNQKGHVPFFENSIEFNKVMCEFIESLQLK